MDNLDYLECVPSTGTPIEKPLVLDDPAHLSWDEHCDLLVVGLGCAGAATALKAVELGVSDVVVADRFEGGGASMLSGGVVYAGGGTRMQKANGFDDTPDSLFNYLAQEIGEARSADTLRRFADASKGMIEWLESHGLVFAGDVAQKKTAFPRAGENLYYSGNEKVAAYALKAPPAPRGHRAQPRSGNAQMPMAGAYLMAALIQKMAAAPGIRIFRQSACRRLMVHEGRVVGAEVWRLPPGPMARMHARLNAASRNPRLAVFGLTKPLWEMLALIERRFARPVRIRARAGVVLSTGGFIYNPLIADRLAPRYKGVARLGTIGDDGSALRLAHSVGARLVRLGNISPWKFIAPPTSWLSGILVSASAERFVNEELYGANLGNALFQKAGGRAWLIFDSQTHAAASEELEKGGLWAYQQAAGLVAMKLATKAASIAELERKLQFPAGGLAKTIDEFNGQVERGEPDPFGRGEEYRRPILEGPFYALDQSVGARMNPIPAITLGGVDVDEETNAALDASGKPISGLYAAGRSAVGLCSENYISGLSLADGIWSGWQAAKAVAGAIPAPAADPMGAQLERQS